MNFGIASLHKILKDETRRKIILLLHNRSGLSYSELDKKYGLLSKVTPQKSYSTLIMQQT